MANKLPKTWCRQLLTRRLSAPQIDAKLDALYKFARQSFPESGCFTLDWLADVLVHIDKSWFDGVVLPGVYHAYGGLHLYLDDSEERVAGYIKETGDKKTVSMHMNRDLFVSLFKQNEEGYHSGGLLCRDRMVCALHVILHEFVHLALTLCDKLGYRPDIRDHGKEFNRIVKNLFGHTDPQHGLIPGYEQFHDLETIRSRLKPGLEVDVFIEGEWVPAKVTKKGKKWVNVSTEDGRNLTVHAGLIRIYSS